MKWRCFGEREVSFPIVQLIATRKPWAVYRKRASATNRLDFSGILNLHSRIQRPVRGLRIQPCAVLGSSPAPRGFELSELFRCFVVESGLMDHARIQTHAMLSTEVAMLGLWSQICSGILWYQIRYEGSSQELIILLMDLFGSYRRVRGHLNPRVICMRGVSD